MVIYETLHDICEEQRSIIDNGVDLSVLTSTFGALPRLTEVGLSFCEAIEDDSSLSPFTAGMTTAEDSHEYHLRVVSNATLLSRVPGIEALRLIPSAYRRSIFRMAMNGRIPS
ncbi:hypothetical protein BKA61DRAFT_618854 [Leptodontidium sp. MPI-SDFR-AT-0119]|nr:hypothetical protein BKA61DRAFT_618854 [Leptodontidium sp. MPI-SDFR-AT-0119]